jgi:tetratricopeptide (TPR) repeat protein
LNYYNRVLAVDPENQSAQYDKALVYYAKKDYRRPVPILLNCLDQHPDYGEAYWLLGDVYLDSHNPDSAKICFDRAYLKGIRNGGFLQLMASFYEKESKFKAAELYRESIQQDSTLVDSYRKLIELDPDRAEEYQQLVRKWRAKN